MPERDLLVILHNVRSSENVGSIFRTADASGASKIYLVGYTPTPLDRFGRKNTKLAKAALGAEEFVSWEARKDTLELFAELKKKGVLIAAVEQSLQSIPYKKFTLQKPTAFVLGNEVEGIPEEILEAADVILEIPLHGKKESLNVSVAAGVILFGVQ